MAGAWSYRPEISVPLDSGKDPDSRCVDMYEREVEEWVRQAAGMPGWKGFDTL